MLPPPSSAIRLVGRSITPAQQAADQKALVTSLQETRLKYQRRIEVVDEALRFEKKKLADLVKKRRVVLRFKSATGKAKYCVE